MKKSTLLKIGVGVAIAVLFVYSLSIIFSKRSAGPAVPPSGVTTSSTPVTIPDKNNQPVHIANIYQNPVAQVQDSYVLSESDFYRITFYKQDSSFAISLLASPLSFARKQAENAFLSKLQINETQACGLKLTVSVPYEVSPAYAGQNVGLSFCPGAASLP